MTKEIPTSTNKTDVASETEQEKGGDHQSGPKHMSRPDDSRRKPKRFYKEAAISPEDDGYAILLDERQIKTPLKATLAVKSKKLAEAIAQEWQDQEEFIDSETMILTKLANTALDRVATRRVDIIDELISYAGSDLMCYRAIEPESLLAKEQETWDPYLHWFKTSHNIDFKLGTGVVHIAQEQSELQKLTVIYDGYDEFTLTALHNMTTMLGSALLPLSLIMGKGSLEEAWSAAHVEEDYQIERWGADEQAKSRRITRLAEFNKSHAFYLLSS